MKNIFVINRALANWLLFVGGLLSAQLALLATISFRFGLSNWLLVVSRVGDAAEYLSMSQSVSAILLQSEHMPFYPILIAIGSLVANPVVAAIAVNILSFLGFGVVMFALTKRLWVGFLASFFPYFLFKYSVYVFADISAFFFAALSFYFLTKNRFLFGLLFGSLAVATHYLALLLVPAFMFSMYRKRVSYAPLGLIPSAPFIAMSILKLVYFGDLLYYLHANLHVWTRAGGGPYGFLTFPFASFLYVFTHLDGLVSSSFPVNLFYALVIFAAVFAFYGLGVYLAYRDRAYLDFAWGLPVLLFIIMLSPIGFFYAPRYGILAFPMLLRLSTFSGDRGWLKIALTLVAIGNVTYSFVSVFLFPVARLA